MSITPKPEDFDEPEVTAVILEVCRSLVPLVQTLENDDVNVGLTRISVRADPRESYSITEQISCGQRMRIKKKTSVTLPLHHLDFNESYNLDDFYNDLKDAERKSNNPNFRETVYINSIWLRDERTSRVAVFGMTKAILPEQKMRLAQEGKFRSSLTLEGVYHIKLSKRGRLKIVEEFLRVPKSLSEYGDYREAIKSGSGSYSALTVANYDIFIPNISQLTDLDNPPLAFRDCTYGFPEIVRKIPKQCSYYTHKQLLDMGRG